MKVSLFCYTAFRLVVLVCISNYLTNGTFLYIIYIEGYMTIAKQKKTCSTIRNIEDKQIKRDICYLIDYIAVTKGKRK